MEGSFIYLFLLNLNCFYDRMIQNDRDYSWGKDKFIYVYKLVYRFNLGPGPLSRSGSSPREAHPESLKIVGPVSGLWGHCWRVLVFVIVGPESAFVF